MLFLIAHRFGLSPLAGALAALVLLSSGALLRTVLPQRSVQISVLGQGPFSAASLKTTGSVSCGIEIANQTHANLLVRPFVSFESSGSDGSRHSVRDQFDARNEITVRAGETRREVLAIVARPGDVRLRLSALRFHLVNEQPGSDNVQVIASNGRCDVG